MLYCFLINRIEIIVASLRFVSPPPQPLLSNLLSLNKCSTSGVGPGVHPIHTLYVFSKNKLSAQFVLGLYVVKLHWGIFNWASYIITWLKHFVPLGFLGCHTNLVTFPILFASCWCPCHPCVKALDGKSHGKSYSLIKLQKTWQK